ncbi:MAG: hypothetical protein WBF17_19215, partial [Phycisphaerae bacterium]
RIEIDGQVLRVRRDPAAMDVHLLMPEGVRLSQTDKYDPQPEAMPKRGRYSDTWHLTAGTVTPALTGQFLSVFLVHRKGAASGLAKVRVQAGTGAVGVRLTMADGAEDVVCFRTDAKAERVSCGRLSSDGRVFAEGTDGSGKATRALRIGGAAR